MGAFIPTGWQRGIQGNRFGKNIPRIISHEDEPLNAEHLAADLNGLFFLS